MEMFSRSVDIREKQMKTRVRNVQLLQEVLSSNASTAPKKFKDNAAIPKQQKDKRGDTKLKGYREVEDPLKSGA
jgi:hypothetical protein